MLYFSASPLDLAGSSVFCCFLSFCTLFTCLEGNLSNFSLDIDKEMQINLCLKYFFFHRVLIFVVVVVWFLTCSRKFNIYFMSKQNTKQARQIEKIRVLQCILEFLTCRPRREHYCSILIPGCSLSPPKSWDENPYQVQKFMLHFAKLSNFRCR